MLDAITQRAAVNGRIGMLEGIEHLVISGIADRVDIHLIIRAQRLFDFVLHFIVRS